MREFDFKAEYQKLLTPEVVAYLTQIHEYKGQQNLFIEAKADALSNLLEVAKIQSTEASNRIEGIITTDDRLEKDRPRKDHAPDPQRKRDRRIPRRAGDDPREPRLYPAKADGHFAASPGPVQVQRQVHRRQLQKLG